MFGYGVHSLFRSKKLVNEVGRFRMLVGGVYTYIFILFGHNLQEMSKKLLTSFQYFV